MVCAAGLRCAPRRAFPPTSPWTPTSPPRATTPSGARSTAPRLAAPKLKSRKLRQVDSEVPHPFSSSYDLHVFRLASEYEQYVIIYNYNRDSQVQIFIACLISCSLDSYIPRLLHLTCFSRPLLLPPSSSCICSCLGPGRTLNNVLIYFDDLSTDVGRI